MKNSLLKAYKQEIRKFMHEQYTDERLVLLLDHARTGHLSYESCCCFVGISNADHALRTDRLFDVRGSHYMNLPMAVRAPADLAYFRLADHMNMNTYYRRYSRDSDVVRRRIIIPMILAELRRRQQSSSPVMVPVSNGAEVKTTA